MLFLSEHAAVYIYRSKSCLVNTKNNRVPAYQIPA